MPKPLPPFMPVNGARSTFSVRRVPARRRACAIAVTGLLLPSLLLAAPSNESPNEGPFKTTTQGDDPSLMLYGHDPVAYFTQDAAVPGLASITDEHLGVTYRFASEANRAAFRADPARYMPQFGGYCSNGIDYAIPGGGGGGPNTWRIYRGKLYVFGGQQARDHFEMDTERNLELAHHYWNTEIAGHSASLTRARRMLFRVPHYASDAELQARWEAMRDAGTLPVMPGQAQVVPR